VTKIIKSKSETKKFYITTALPYVNAGPHLGHVLEYIQTDTIARYHRLKNEEVFLLTGSDENSLKNVQAAEAKGIPIQELCNENTAKFIEIIEKIGFSHNNFIRTSNKKEHWPGVQKLWKLCYKNGDIYKKKYTGLYCVGCEAFYKEEELEDGLCPEHKKPLEIVEEENYFFRLSKYQDQLKKLIEKDVYKIVPEIRKNEVLSFIEKGLEDFSISRSVKRARNWGIPVPGDDSQIIYVWFDALANYLTGVGYGINEKMFKEKWPADVHVIGKGITRFHAIYWPAMLLSAGIKLPKILFVHGYITIEGHKMSKSLGNILNPMELTKKYEVDTIRYYLLSGITTFEDGNFAETRLIELHNNELIGNLGNLVNRTMIFTNRYFNSKIPECKLTEEDKAFIQKQKELQKKIESLLDEFKLKEAIDEIMYISKNNNQYFQERKPWDLVKTDKERCGTVIYILLNQVKDLGILIEPYLPFTSEKIFKQLNIKPKKWNDLGKLSLEHGKDVGEADILFKKFKEEQISEFKIKDKKQRKKEESSFGIVLEVGKIIEVKKHPNADKLYVEKVKMSNNEIRTIVSGLIQYYKPDELFGKKVIIVKNLKPAKMRGIISEGMLLAAEDKKNVEIIEPDAKVGEKIVLPHETNKNKISIDELFEHKWEVKDKQVYFDGEELIVSKPVKTKKVKQGKVR